jgi:2-keto-3-deoxy-galactonokinase
MIDLRTMMTGELFAAVMQHTILRHAADLEHNEIDEAALLNGFAYAKKRGVNEALFKTRILSTMFGATKEQCYSFLLGCVLCDEVDAILKASEETVVLGGQKQFRTALTLLLLQNSDKKIVTLTDAEVERSTSLGAIRIFELC